MARVARSGARIHRSRDFSAMTLSLDIIKPRWLEGVSMRAIAREHGVSIGTVAGQLGRAHLFKVERPGVIKRRGKLAPGSPRVPRKRRLPHSTPRTPRPPRSDP